MSLSYAIRGRTRAQSTVPLTGQPRRLSPHDLPGAFQNTILSAFELREGYREVFLLKEIQGYSLAEIAATLGISIDTALAHWKSAHREIGQRDDSDAMELGK